MFVIYYFQNSQQQMLLDKIDYKNLLFIIKTAKNKQLIYSILI
ncbi:hypothetical protein RC62_432 [Flavobacterium aquidurense]|uniref:Uncharacterized protein n=1 Tax=Flavobacterium aquidurense TaxID=362413 RepID=A0A0Q0RUA8_9FLAO|nr:hypothetical protein RC62_432 [Flavobacterium aquidurense]